MTVVDYADLTNWHLAEGSLRRDPPPRAKILKPDVFWQSYDAHTLAYDAQFDPVDRRLRLYGPRAFQLAKTITSAELRSDQGQHRFLRQQTSRQLDIFDFACEAFPNDLWADETPLTAHSVDRDRLRGARAVMTVSKDNDLDWITDWARFHSRTQGADTVVIADNGSTSYETRDIGEALSSIGLSHVVVVAAPFKYGPRADQMTRSGRANFLQPCLLNLLRDRFLREAAGILVCDIDELVLPTSRTIFEAIQGPLGYLAFTGVWRHLDVGGASVRHAAHTLRVPGEKACPTKYAVRPTGPLGRRPMQVHQLAGVPRRLTPSGGFSYLHCSAISTSWKYARTSLSSDMVKDPETVAWLKAGLGGPI